MLYPRPLLAVSGLLKEFVRKEDDPGTGSPVRETQAFLNSPTSDTLKGLRERSILSVLIGYGLRRQEVADLTFEHIQQREGRWQTNTVFGFTCSHSGYLHQLHVDLFEHSGVGCEFLQVFFAPVAC